MLATTLAFFLFGFFHWLWWLVIFLLDVVVIASVLLGRSSAERKVLWTIAILFLPVIGIILYFTIGRSSQDV